MERPIRNFTDIANLVVDFDKISPAPLSKADLFVKNIDSSKISPSARILLSLAAPHFSDRLVFRNELDEIRKVLYNSRYREQLIHKRTKRALLQHPSRRFAGNYNLPRGRYYSLSKNMDGQDNGTLRSELMAYQQMHWSGLITIEDSEHLELARRSYGHLRKELDKIQKSIILIFDNPKGVPNRLFKMIKPIPVKCHGQFLSEDGQILSLATSIPYNVKSIRLNQVLDLREKSAQNWLLKNIINKNIPFYSINHNGELYQSKPSDFYSILRSLVTTVHGGNLLTDIIGGYLRYVGAEGLIFPSARADNSVTYNSKNLDGWQGWNFVDYRGAEVRTNHFVTDLKEVYDLPVREFLETTDFRKDGGWTRNSVLHGFERMNLADVQQISQEKNEQRFKRLEDYWFYWKTIEYLNDPDFETYLSKVLDNLNFKIKVSDISPRMWQYVLHEFIDLNGKFPELNDTRGKHEPLGIYLINKEE